MLTAFGNLRLNVKVALLGAGSALVTAVALVALVVWQSGEYHALAQHEVNKLIEADLDHITRGVYNLVQTEDEAVQHQVNYNLNVARHILAQAGEVDVTAGAVFWTAVDQYTGARSTVRLPEFRVGGRWLGRNSDPTVETVLVDEVSRLVGESATVFQRMNARGDMLRVATTVRTAQGTRAIGTYIPAVKPDGTRNPVIAAALQGQTYHGRAFVVDSWYLTAYAPILDLTGALVGMLYVGTQQKTVEARVRQAVLQIDIGQTGYVYVLSGTGEDRGRYVISQQGERDGEDIWESRDSEGRLVIQEIIRKAIALKPGELATVRYRWQNPGESKPRWKVARLAYYAPWDWVIGTGVYEDELQVYLAVLDGGRIRMTTTMGLAGLAIALVVGLIGVFIAWTLARPIRQITAAVETIHRGELAQVEIRSQDEIGILAQAFNSMADRLRQTMAGLRASEEKYRRIVDDSVEGIYRCTLDGQVLSANPAFSRVLGYESPEKAVADLLDARRQLYVVPEDRDRLLAPLLERGEVFGFETQFRRRDGQTIWVSINARLLRNEAGTPTLVQGLLTDITDRKQAENERTELEARLRQSQKMESIGLLAGGVAHDFNNLLTPIFGYTDLLLADCPTTDPRYQPLEEIRQAADQARDLTHQLLAFSRKQLIDLRPIELDALIHRCELMLRRTIRENVHLAIHLASPLAPVRADASQLEQVLLNLAINAQDAMPDGGLLRIEATECDLETATPSRPPELPPGPYILLEVSDTGVGMAPETLEHLFEPFFTTKGVGKGTGLGLATAYGTIKQHGGAITVDSRQQQGSTFRIFLPRLPRTEAVPAPPPMPESLPRGTETILVVEDNDMVRTITGRMIQGLGYEVLIAANGDQALELAAAHPGSLHLLLTDVVMPRMNGRELFERLQSLLPSLKVLFMSGYTSDVIGHHGVLDAGLQFLPKPFSLAALATKLREVLEG